MFGLAERSPDRTMAKIKPEALGLSSPDQISMPCVAPVSVRERLEWIATLPLHSDRQQKPLDVGFWNPMRNQIELF